MKPMIMLTGLLSSLHFALATFAGEPNERLLFDFSAPAHSERWRPVNDGVMGGKSEGQFEITGEGTMQFFGNLSLENNGGFASVRSRVTDFEFTPEDQIVVRLCGDGRDYLLNLYVPTRRIAYSYRASIQTTKDEWIEVSIPLQDFEATSFGRTIRGAGPVDADRVNALGFMLSDKSPGPFTLQIDWIKVVRENKDG